MSAPDEGTALHRLALAQGVLNNWTSTDNPAEVLDRIADAIDPPDQPAPGPVHVETREELQITCVDPEGRELADEINLLSFGAQCQRAMTDAGYYRDPRVQRRTITTTRTASAWTDVPDDELERAET